MGRDIEETGIGDGHVTGLISDYIDGILPPSEQERVRAHIAACRGCRADYIELKAVQQLLHAVPMEAPPRAFTLTQEMAGSQQAKSRSLLARLLAPAFAPTLAAGSVVAFALLLLVMVSARSAPGIAALTASPSVAQGQSAYNAAPDGGTTGDADMKASTPGALSKQPSLSSTGTPQVSVMSAPAHTGTAATTAGQGASPKMLPQAAPTASLSAGASGGQSSTSSVVNTPQPASNLPPLVASGNSSPTTIALDLPNVEQANPSAAQPPAIATPANQGNTLATLAEAVLGLLAIALAAGAVIAWQKRS